MAMAEVEQDGQPSDHNMHDANQLEFLTFFLNNEEYGLNILSVREIRGWEEPTPVPHAPLYIKGVINLRGTVIPVVDLRTRFFLPPLDTVSSSSVVIVLQVEGLSRGLQIVGLVVDRVSDVYSINAHDLVAPPSIGTTISADLVNGIVTVQNKMIIILNEVKFMEFNDQGPI
jgi:purine-binding chemotaxis protein CheW